MQKFAGQPQFDFLTWFLTGLVVLVLSYSILPAGKDAVLCEQERQIEIEADDDKQDSHELESSLDLLSNNFSASETWQFVDVFFLLRPSHFEVHRNLGRGPPHC